MIVWGTMTRVYLVRHGQTDYNENGIIQGQLDTELNETGEQQALALSERLQEENIDAIYSSTLQRAKNTAELIAGPHSVEIRPLEDLKDRSYGELEGEPKEKREEVIRKEGTPWHAWRPEDGEHLEAVRKRAVPALDAIRKHHGDETVVVVAHGNVNKSVLASLIGADPGHGHTLTQDNACLNELEHEEYRGWRVRTVNDTQHLSD